MVFGIEIEDFGRIACLLVEGHVTQMPDVIIYSSMATREAVYIAITMAALCNPEVCDGTQMRKGMDSIQFRVWV